MRGNQRTRTEVIRRELLFQVGDRADSALLAETERNLRALRYLGRAVVRTEAAAAGSVLVIVEVEDLYSRALSPLLSGDTDEVSFGAVALDYNLLGLGQVASVSLFHDAVSGNRASAFYREPRLAGSRLRLAMDGTWAEEGHTVTASLAQPLYSLATRWAYGVALSSRASRVRLYSGGDLVARYDDRRDAGSAWLARSYGGRTKVRPGLRLAVSDRSFDASAPFSYEPSDRRRVLPSLSITVWRPRYVTDRYVRFLGPQEDFQVGSWLAARAGVSRRALGSDRDFGFLSVTLAPRHRFDSGWYGFGSVSLNSRWRSGGYWHLITSSRLVTYRRLRSWPFSPTFAARGGFDTLSRPEDAGSQFLLGVDGGLRGFAPRRFDGTRRWVVGAELRPVFLRRDLWALGGALFADAGAAWTPSESASVRPAVGVGVRVGLPRVYDTPVLRADLARGLRGGGVWQVSFGLGQFL